MPELSLPATHRVVACEGGGERTRLERRALPRPGREQMLLRVRAVGLCGTDLFKLASGTVQPGLVLGHELVGELVAAGDAVRSFAAGDRVAVPHHVPCGRCAKCLRGSETLCETFRENLLEPGGFADFVLVRERAVREAARRVPDAVSDEIAVWMEPAACVLRAVRRAQLFDAGLAAVLGAGSMGLLHLLVLRAERPQVRVVMVDPMPARRALANRLGASGVAAPADARRTVAELSDGLGADAVFDTVGGARALDDALGLSREGGSVVLFAHAGEGERARFDINGLFKLERRLIGSYSGGPAEQDRVFELMLERRLDPSPLISHRLPLEQFDRGVALARRREAIKVVFTTGTADRDRGD